jgi:hypothetical protein
MITLFTTAKLFIGNGAVTRYKTLAGWLTLMPDAEVPAPGEKTGVAEAGHELGVRLSPDIERNKFRTPLLRSIFSAAAEAHATQPLPANSDVLFTNKLLYAMKAVRVRMEKLCAHSPRIFFGADSRRSPTY